MDLKDILDAIKNFLPKALRLPFLATVIATSAAALALYLRGFDWIELIKDWAHLGVLALASLSWALLFGMARRRLKLHRRTALIGALLHGAGTQSFARPKPMDSRCGDDDFRNRLADSNRDLCLNP